MYRRTFLRQPLTMRCGVPRVRRSSMVTSCDGRFDTLWLRIKPGDRFGSWIVIRHRLMRVRERTCRGRPQIARDPLVEVRCTETNVQRLIDAPNLLSGKSTGPHARPWRYLGIPRKACVQLQQRYSAIVQRCRTDKAGAYQKNYGSRGIANRFKSCEHFVRWVWETFPLADYDGLDIDRVDNDGHYEPGNLRVVAPSVNQENTRRSNGYRIEWRGEMWSASRLRNTLMDENPGWFMSRNAFEKRLRAGMSVEDLLTTKLKGRYRKRASTTSSTLDRGTASRQAAC